jgi:hypothetical protein
MHQWKAKGEMKAIICCLLNSIHSWKAKEKNILDKEMH